MILVLLLAACTSATAPAPEAQQQVCQRTLWPIFAHDVQEYGRQMAQCLRGGGR